ncbi:Glutamine synthetase leaf isozyme [Durusdinium trenchii]|uniref:Glutamine synthetase n=1 Tax=Durusdinium trenchii TaxID=1381693 RepID=A0ABP0L2C3_9DINO
MPYVLAEYVWIDADGGCRSKTKVMHGKSTVTLKDLPHWNYDGSSTGQAPGEDSEVIIHPAAVFSDPFRGGNHVLVMTDTYTPAGEPIPTNTRAPAKEIFDMAPEEEPWFGIEQEYTLFKDGTPLGWPKATARSFGGPTVQLGFPGAQGPYYCAAGADVAFGRDICETHMMMCLEAGINISGINAEVMPGQWEYQVGPCTGIESGDHHWMSRYILNRVCEDKGVVCSYEPKPIPGDWNGAGCHTNFSTKNMREKKDGYEKYILPCIENLGKKHAEHIAAYGEGNDQRLTGRHETASIDTFKWGVADRGASVRVGNDTKKNGKGYLEDRRPASNMDPYIAADLHAPRPPCARRAVSRGTRRRKAGVRARARAQSAASHEGGTCCQAWRKFAIKTMAECVVESLFNGLLALALLQTLLFLGGVAWKYLKPIVMKRHEQRKYHAKHMLQSVKQEKQKMRNKKSGKEPWELDHKTIKFKKKLAKGNLGEVWLGTWLGSPVAIKTVLKTMAKDHEFISRFMLEIKLMSNLHHPNIVMFLGACINPVSKMCLVLEYCIYGSLHDFLSTRKAENDPEDLVTLHRIIRFGIDIARGVNYIHQKCNIIQRDLKARNVLVDVHLNAKVADFGLSRLKDEDAGMTACGTPAWTAPEIVKLEQYDEKVDVYSFGIVMWELISREEPYQGQGGVQVAYMAVEQGLRPEIPPYCPELFAQLMVECWEENPDMRPDFGQILERLFAMMKVIDDAVIRDLPNAIS